MGTLEGAFTTMGNKVDFNILIFCSLLGALVYVVAMSGGTKAYGSWAVTKIKGRKGTLLATSGLGILIFIDDYFNCLSVGTVMRPLVRQYPHLACEARLHHRLARGAGVHHRSGLLVGCGRGVVSEG